MLTGLGLTWLFFFVIGILISIAPLMIWRNTNRQNKLLALMARQVGVPATSIRIAWLQGGSRLPQEILKEPVADSVSKNLSDKKDEK